MSYGRARTYSFCCDTCGRTNDREIVAADLKGAEKKLRYLGWFANNGRHFCPLHKNLLAEHAKEQ